MCFVCIFFVFFFQAEDGIRDTSVTGVQTCALPISANDRDLHFPVQIVGCPIVRESDGLAMSSRNAYLDPQQRRSALALHRALLEIERAFGRGEQDPETLISAAKQVILQESAVRLDYLEIVDPDSLEPISQTAWGQPPSAVRPSAARRSRSALVAIAAFVGTTRLIDNVVLNLA